MFVSTITLPPLVCPASISPSVTVVSAAVTLPSAPTSSR